MDNYDVIVVGAGNSGLVSALYLLKKGYKVLLLEQQNKIGGLNQTMIKGRFEFDMSLFNYFIDSKKEDYSIKNIFEELGIESNLEFSKIPEAFRVITREGGDIPARDITMPIGIENFISKMEQIVKDSETAVRTFFELALECKEALEYIMNTNEIDYDYIKENYNNFMRVAPYSLSKVLDIIDMPLEAQEILNTYWIYLGSPETEITFAQYAAFVYDAVNYGILIPNTKNYGIAADIANEYLISGGELKLNSPVVKLLVDDNKINGVKLKDGKTYYSNHVIVNGNMNVVYNKLLEPNEIPREALKNMNQREEGAKVLTVYLGLNRSAEELGLKNFAYFLYDSMDSDVEFNRMNRVNSRDGVVLCINNAYKDASPKGTCILTLSTFYFGDCLDSEITYENYYDFIDDTALKLIGSFEKRAKVKIKEYIEEVEIVSPLDYAKFNGVLNGVTYGYRLKGHDNLLPRYLNRNNEIYIDGLRLCGGFDGDLYGYSSSYVDGINVAKMTIEDMGGEDSGKNKN